MGTRASENTAIPGAWNAEQSPQAMLYATEGIDAIEDLAKPMVGVASVW